VAKLVGVEHVGVGSDSDLQGYDRMPPKENEQLRAGYKGSYAFREKIDIEGLNHPKRMFDLAEGLIRRKYNDSDIELILAAISSVCSRPFGRFDSKTGCVVGPIHLLRRMLLFTSMSSTALRTGIALLLLRVCALR